MPDDTQQTLEGNIEPIEIQEEMERSFLDYAMSVITARALPDRETASSPCSAASSTGCTSRGCARTGSTRSRRRRSARSWGSTTRTAGGHLRRARPHGPGVLAAVPAHRRARQLRIPRPERQPGGPALHRGTPRPTGDGAHRGDRREHRRPGRDVRRPEPGAARSAGAVPESARQRRRRDRGRDGDEHPAPQPERGHRRLHPRTRQPRCQTQ